MRGGSVCCLGGLLADSMVLVVDDQTLEANFLVLEAEGKDEGSEEGSGANEVIILRRKG